MFRRFLGNKRKNGSESKAPNRLANNAEKAIAILGELQGSFTDREILGVLVNNGIDLSDARQIIIFLPVAFCRQLLPTVSWSDQYIDKTGKTREFRQTETYLAISEVTSSYFSSWPNKDVIIKIGGRSAEFHLINEFLHVGGTLEDIELTSLHILM